MIEAANALKSRFPIRADNNFMCSPSCFSATGELTEVKRTGQKRRKGDRTCTWQRAQCCHRTAVVLAYWRKKNKIQEMTVYLVGGKCLSSVASTVQTTPPLFTVNLCHSRIFHFNVYYYMWRNSLHVWLHLFWIWKTFLVWTLRIMFAHPTWLGFSLDLVPPWGSASSAVWQRNLPIRQTSVEPNIWYLCI